LFYKYLEKYSEYLIELTDSQKKLLEKYFLYLQEVAVPFKFIGHRGSEEIFVKNILDSLLPLNNSIVYDLLINSKQKTILDLGSGAGLPGVPLSIVNSQNNYILLDSSENRMDFVEEFIQKEKTSNLKTLCSNVDDAKVKADIVLFRAFQKPLTSFELSLRFVKNRSKIMYYRSRPFFESSHVMSKKEEDDPKNKVDRQSKNQKIINRIQELGYVKADFMSLESPLELENRGIYLLEYEEENKNKLQADVKQVSYPRKMKQIKRDKLNQEII